MEDNNKRKKKWRPHISGTDAQLVSDMLNGRKLIKVCDIPRLAGVLGVKTDDICAVGIEKR